MSQIQAEIHVGATGILCVSDDLRSSGAAVRISWTNESLGLHLRLLRSRFLQGSRLVAVVVHLSDDLGLRATGPENATLVRIWTRAGASPSEAPVTLLQELADFLARHGFLSVSMTVPALDGTGPLVVHYGTPDTSKPWVPLPSMIAEMAHGGRMMPPMLARELKKRQTVSGAANSMNTSEKVLALASTPRAARRINSRSALLTITGLLAFGVVVSAVAFFHRWPSLYDNLIVTEGNDLSEPLLVAPVLPVVDRVVPPSETVPVRDAIAPMPLATPTAPMIEDQFENWLPTLMADVPPMRAVPPDDADHADIYEAGLILPERDGYAEGPASVRAPMRLPIPTADETVALVEAVTDPPESAMVPTVRTIAVIDAEPVARALFPLELDIENTSAFPLVSDASGQPMEPVLPLENASQSSTSPGFRSAEQPFLTRPIQRPIHGDSAHSTSDLTSPGELSERLSDDAVPPSPLDQPPETSEASWLLLASSRRPILRPQRNAVVSAIQTQTASGLPVAEEATVRPNRTASADPNVVSSVGTTATGAMVEINLLAIYGPETDRQALVGLPSGRTVILQRGALLLGWRVEEIRHDGLTLASQDTRLGLYFRQ